jgi:hypothetical protein
MNACVLRFHEATVAHRPAHVARAARRSVRRAGVRRQRSWWPEASSATWSWMGYRLAPRA